MRILGGLGFALLIAGGLFAQRGNYVNPTPVLTGGFGNVVYPGGTSATTPGLTRFNGNVVYPGGGGPKLLVPNANQPGRARRGSNALVYAYPVYVGGYGYGYDPSAMEPAPAPQQQQPNVTVVYPPQPAPVIINQFGSGDATQGAVHPRVYEMPPEPQAEAAPETPEATHYLIAFKDHTIYSAIAYWVDGDTLHYFTGGNTHNQVSLSLVDRDLTMRLNKESGVDIKLPAPKQ